MGDNTPFPLDRILRNVAISSSWRVNLGHIKHEIDVHMHLPCTTDFIFTRLFEFLVPTSKVDAANALGKAVLPFPLCLTMDLFALLDGLNSSTSILVWSIFVEWKISSVGVPICYLPMKICYMDSSFCLNILVLIGYDTSVYTSCGSIEMH